MNFDTYEFDARISRAYKELLGIDKEINTDNDPGKLGSEMATLEQRLKSEITNPSNIDRVSFDNFQKLVTRIGWLHREPKKFADENELADLNKYFEEWLNNAYNLFGKN